MPLSNAEKQARWQAKRNALTKSHPDIIEAEALRAVERAAELSDAERDQLANKFADIGMKLLHQAQRITAAARRLRPPGWHPPGFPP
jgi:hypothetical protein